MEEKQKKDNLNKKMIVGIVIILIIFIVGISIYFTRKGNEQKPAEQQEPVLQNQEEYTIIDMENTQNAKIENGKKENTSKKVAEEKQFNEIKVSEVKLVAQNGITTFTAKADNISDKKFEAKPIVIIFKDNEGKEFSRVPGYLGDINPKESNHIIVSTSDDIANAFDYEITF